MIVCTKCVKFHLQCECNPPTIKLSSFPKPRTNQRGFTLLEMLVALVILGILVTIMTSLFAHANLVIKKLTQATQVNIASAPKARLVPITSQCQALDGIYSGKTPDGDTLYIYTDSNCSHLLGTLGRLNNESWFNEGTNSMWLTFSNTQLKLLVVKY